MPEPGGVAAEVEAPAETSLRLDKWLWFARFFKTRSLAAKLCAGRKVRLNRVPVRKAHQAVRPGDVLTFPQGWHIRVVRVLALCGRRGSAPEARRLYEDLAPPESPQEEPPVGERRPGAGRPTKRERRAINRLGEES